MDIQMMNMFQKEEESTLVENNFVDSIELFKLSIIKYNIGNQHESLGVLYQKVVLDEQSGTILKRTIIGELFKKKLIQKMFGKH